MIFKIIGGKAVRYDSTGGITKIDDISVDFSQAESRENISSADNVKTILGKIMKWFSDLSAGAASSLLGQNLTAGKVLVSDDGGKVAASAIDASKVRFLDGVTGDVQEQINSLNSALENIGGDSESTRFLEKENLLNAEFAYKGMCCLLITCNGASGNLYAVFLVQGYGATSARNHVTKIHGGAALSCVAMDNKGGVKITSGSSWNCSVLALYGKLPTIKSV